MEIKAKKSLGQNFLQDESILNQISDSIITTEKDLIIEIGPGKGALTKHLMTKPSFLLCYEIDERMKPILNKLENNKTKIIYNDFLKTNIEEDIKDINYNNIYIIANIPYYITTPIIKHVINLKNLKSMTLLVQKEVAKRFSAKPNTKDYGSLTVFLNYYFNINYLFDVKKTCFSPIPNVDSAVINFTKKDINYKKIAMFLLRLLPFIAFTGIVNIILGGVGLGILISVRLILVCQVTYIFSKKMTPKKIQYAIEKILLPLQLFKVNTKEIGIMVAISISFIPIIQKEIQNLKYSLTSKGFQINFRNIVKRPNVIIAPLITSVVKRTTEIEESLISRGYVV